MTEMGYRRAMVALLQSSAPPDVKRAIACSLPLSEAQVRAYAAALRAEHDVRGEFVELIVALSELQPAIDVDLAQARMRELAPQIDRDWWRLFSQYAYTLNCGAGPRESRLERFAFECPLQWEQLRLTSDPAIRACDQCGELVFRVLDRAAADVLARRGACIAVSARLADVVGTEYRGIRMEPIWEWAHRLFDRPPPR